MGKAFQCDLCADLESGEPSQRLTITPTGAPTANRIYDLCAECATSFADWRCGRIPHPDDPGTAS